MPKPDRIEAQEKPLFEHVLMSAIGSIVDSYGLQYLLYVLAFIVHLRISRLSPSSFQLLAQLIQRPRKLTAYGRWVLAQGFGNFG